MVHCQKELDFERKPLIGILDISAEDLKKPCNTVLNDLDKILDGILIGKTPGRVSETKLLLKEIVNVSRVPVGITVSSLNDFLFIQNLGMNFILAEGVAGPYFFKDSLSLDDLDVIKECYPKMAIMCSLSSSRVPFIIHRSASPKAIARKMADVTDSFVFGGYRTLDEVRKIKKVAPKHPVLVGNREDLKNIPIANGAVICCNQLKGKT